MASECNTIELENRLTRTACVCSRHVQRFDCTVGKLLVQTFRYYAVTSFSEQELRMYYVKLQNPGMRLRMEYFN